MIENILNILQSSRFDVNQEKITQSEIEAKLMENQIPFNREYHLDKNNIPDFFINGIAIEIKIKGNAARIYQQCKRYASFESVTHLILVTNRSMGFPKDINGKPCYVVNIGRAWL